MTQHVTAVFENGNLKLVSPLQGIPEHSMVNVMIEGIIPTTRNERLAMLREVPVADELAASIDAGRKRKWNPEEF